MIRNPFRRYQRGGVIPGGPALTLVHPDDRFISEAQLRRVAAEQTWPRLDVDGLKYLSVFGWRWAWRWQVISPDGQVLDEDEHDTHPEALAVGMAHLAVHSAAWAVDQLGAELPAGWMRIQP